MTTNVERANTGDEPASTEVKPATDHSAAMETKPASTGIILPTSATPTDTATPPIKTTSVGLASERNEARLEPIKAVTVPTVRVATTRTAVTRVSVVASKVTEDAGTAGTPVTTVSPETRGIDRPVEARRTTEEADRPAAVVDRATDGTAVVGRNAAVAPENTVRRTPEASAEVAERKASRVA
jgi:hypothetical protein